MLPAADCLSESLAPLAMMDCQAPSNAAIKVRTKQPGQPAELATTYVMLADPLSSYVSGAAIAVSGGKLELRDVVANYPFLNSRVTRYKIREVPECPTCQSRSRSLSVRSCQAHHFNVTGQSVSVGGQSSQIHLGDFLTRGHGPEQQALIRMIATLVESTPVSC
jgi:hypothetical protein